LLKPFLDCISQGIELAGPSGGDARGRGKLRTKPRRRRSNQNLRASKCRPRNEQSQRIDANKWVSADIPVRGHAPGKADGIGLQVSTDCGVVVSEIVVEK
jgi:hypothetical protein